MNRDTNAIIKPLNVIKQLTIKIYGSVQGVSFRYYSVDKARELGLTGFVRNEPDGTVYIVAQGQQDRLKELLSWCRIGPQFAQVERVEASWGKAAGRFEEFKPEVL